MSLIPIISFCVHLVVNGWLVVILVRRRIARKLPWFTAYIASELVGASIGLPLWLADHRLYIAFSWWMTAAQITLIVGAVRESFVKIFIGFRSLSWFPWLVRGVIAMVLLYSAWKAVYAPAVKTNRLVSLLADGEFAFRWTIVAVGLLSVVLERLFNLSRQRREAAVLDGCAVASIGTLAWTISVSLYGIRFISVTQYFTEMGYLLATVIWIKYMSRPEPLSGLKETGMTPEQIGAELRRYRQAAERFLK